MLVERISDPELSQLQAYMLICRPREVVGATRTGSEATLKHFRVELEPGPPDTV